LLNIPYVQQKFTHIAETELSNLLKTTVKIQKVDINWLNRLELKEVIINDQDSIPILIADKMTAYFKFLPIFKNEWIFTTVRFFGFTLNINKETPESPSNMQFIIDALSKNDGKKSNLKLNIKSIHLRRGNFNFDINSKEKTKDQFSPNHISVNNISGRLSIKHFSNDSIIANIKKLNLKEASGIEIDKLSLDFVGNRDTAYIKNLELNLANSSINIPTAGISLSGVKTASDLFNDSFFVFNISKSRITPSDFKAFSKSLNNFNDQIDLSADLSGYFNSLNLNKLTLSLKKEILFDGSLTLNGLTDKNREANLFCKVNKLFATTEGINILSNNLSDSHITIPKPVMNIQSVNFTGEISGFIDNLVAFGKLTTPVGSVQMDLLIKNESKEKNILNYKGSISSTDLQLNKLFEEGNPFGNIRLNAEIDLKHKLNRNISGKINAQINELFFNDYSYENIFLEGLIKENGYEGIIRINDPNGKLELQGILNNDKEKPTFDFMANIRNFHPDKLNFTNKYEEPDISLGINANFTGNNPDDFMGNIELEDFSFYTKTDSFVINDLRIDAVTNEFPNKQIFVTSDFINGQISGEYSFSTIINDLYDIADNYLPSLIDRLNVNTKSDKHNLFDFVFTIKNTGNISKTLKLPVTIIDKCVVKGNINNITNNFYTNISIPQLAIGKSIIDSLNLDLATNNENIKLDLNALLSTTKRNKTVNNKFKLTTLAEEDKISTTLNWANDLQEKFEAEIMASAIFITEDGDNKKIRTEISVQPTQIILKDSLWNMAPASVTITNEDIDIDNFIISKEGQFLHINGLISKKPQELLFIDLKDIELTYIFDLVNIPALQFGGKATGTVNARNLLEIPALDGRLEIQDFAFNQSVLGKLNLSSEWDQDRNGILLLGTVYNKNDESTWTDVNGYIYPVGENKGLSLFFDANELDISFLQRYVDAFADSLSGHCTGNVHLYGNFSDIYIEGAAHVKNGKMKVNVLNTTYSFSDSIILKKDAIIAQNTSVYDKYNNVSALNFNLIHNSFDDITYNLDLKANRMFVYDIPESINPQIYGQLFASGVVNIKGTEKNIIINANARTENGTSVGFNFLDNTSIESYDFISFLNKNEISDQNKTSNGKLNSGLSSKNKMEYFFDCQINVTPEANFEFMMDATSGDRIKGFGSGDIHVLYGSQEDFQMFGNYVISSGTYNFSLQQMIRKRFDIRDGSAISFFGDPMRANLNIKAIYNLTANIQDLEETLVYESVNTSVPVNCVLDIYGVLQNPTISFDLELPNSNKELERQIKSFIDTEDMMTRQIIYLLVLNKFYTPDYSRNDLRINEFSAVASSALSAQLSTILSTITDKVQIGTNIRSRQDGIKDNEVEMLLSSQLLNNRLIFNGNFGYKDNAILTNTFIGEFDLEYKLTRIGEISLKAYSHANDLYRYNLKSLTRQGVGLIFKKDFATLHELLRKRKRREDEVKN
jgi:hypothetical protein